MSVALDGWLPSRVPDVVKRGMAFGVAAYAIWGLFPLYWPLLKPAGAVEILAHRIMWSLVAVAAVLVVRRGRVRGVGLRRGALLVGAAVVITVNWGTYIYAVNGGRTVEAALGYFITPLISVLFGVAVFRERLRPWQWTAIGMLQYVAPVLQFLIGVFVQYEEMPPSRWAGFLLVWLALVTLTWDGLRAGRREAVPEAA